MIDAIKLIFFVLIISLSGCVNNTGSEIDSGKSKMHTDFNLLYDQVELFYMRYPEYIDSEEKDIALYKEFERIKKLDAYKKMDLYNLLVSAHNNLTHNE
ncbi:hypothetical protein R5P42_005029 [Escherichia coli]|nr:hypothetical protein [Escherichia coli]